MIIKGKTLESETLHNKSLIDDQRLLQNQSLTMKFWPAPNTTSQCDIELYILDGYRSADFVLLLLSKGVGQTKHRNFVNICLHQVTCIK